MTPIPFASFLAGSLLTILLPLAVFMALSVWYLLFLRRAPDPGLEPSTAEAGADTAAARPDATGMGDRASSGSQPS